MKKVISVILVILWMLAIFLLSSQDSLETNNTTDIIYRLFNIKTDSLTVFILIRKFAHFFEYLVLGILVYNMFKKFGVSNLLACTMLLCIIYSCTDEIHQLFVPGRTGRLYDCLIDALGTSIGILIYKIGEKLHKRLSKN